MIYLDQTNTSGLDKFYVGRVVASGHVSTAAPEVIIFENEMANYLGVPWAIATNSGTAALHLALLACGIGPGDEVIIPALTFIATANAVTYTGAKPVFVDVDLETWCMSTIERDAHWGHKTAAVIPAHLYGNVCRNRSFSIEDAAESLGAKIDKNHAGTYGVYGVYSFNGNKIMSTGGGGLIIGGDREKVQSLLVARETMGLAYNYRMPALNAALGLSQLKRLPEFLEKKRRFNEIYRNELAGLVKFQEPTPSSNPSWWFTACLFEGRDVEEIQKKLWSKAVPARRVFAPIPHMLGPYFDGERDFPNSKFIYDYGLCLPSSTLNEERDILAVCKAVKEVL